MNLVKRANYVLKGEDAVSTMEIVVWFSIVLVFGTALFMFRDEVTDFIDQVIERVRTFRTE